MITIAFTAVTAKLVNADRAAKMLVREALTFTVAGAEHSPRFKPGGWDGTGNFFQFTNETFPAGFVFKIYSVLMKAGYAVSLRPSREIPAPLGPLRPVVDSFGTTDPNYSYQFNTADKLVKFRQIIAQVATGGGKSRIARICHKRIGRTTMFLTTRGVLMHQMAGAIRAMGEPVGMVGDGDWSPVAGGFNCAMVQTLAARLELRNDVKELEDTLTNREAAEDRKVQEVTGKLIKAKRTTLEIQTAIATLRARQVAARVPDAELIAKIQKGVIEHNERRLQVIEFLKTVDLLILEEAHEASGDGYTTVANHCTSAWYRLALTATPFMREDEKANMQLMAVAGPVAIKVTEEELIRLGILATPHFRFAGLPPVKGLFRSTVWPRCYEIGITTNEARNRIAVQEALTARAYGLPVLVLVQRKEHGKTISRMLTEAGLKANFIFGEHDQDERQAALNALADGRIDVLIGSTILDVGVDVPSIGLVINLGGAKAEIALRQRIGRGLRKKRSGPNVTFFLDFDDSGNNTLRTHSESRKAIILGTRGFGENFVNTFDYDGVGFKALSKV